MLLTRGFFQKRVIPYFRYRQKSAKFLRQTAVFADMSVYLLRFKKRVLFYIDFTQEL